MNCANCGYEIAEQPFKVGIWVEVMGDEYGFGYVACPKCAFYTETSCRDSITGGDIEYDPRAIPKQRGEDIVRLIGTCPDPTKKCCDCPAHEKFRRSPPPSRPDRRWD